MKDNMKKNKLSVVISSLILAGAMFHSGISVAQTTNQQDKLSFAQASKGKLTQIGSPNGVMTPLKGFAKDLPLLTVLRQITPNGWLVKKSDNEVAKLDTQMLVSWQGGNNWVETLGSLVDNYPLNANINWDKKEITLMALENKVVAKTMIFELETSQSSINNVSEVARGASEQVKEQPKQEVAVAPVPTWTINTGISLKENVELWAKASGYRLVWTGEDYSVEDKRTLSGNFDDETGPIKQLSVDYGPKSRVQQPLSFQFFQNSTLVVENWKFEQIGYPQFGSKK